jgi:ubiquinone/menaquinone biosynthesis C-methylase UbiE
VRSPVSGSGGTPGGWFSWKYRLSTPGTVSTRQSFPLQGGGLDGRGGWGRGRLRVEFPPVPASPTATPEQIKDVNTRYHDAAAEQYDAKWGIDFGAIGQEQVRQKLAKALGGLDGRRFGDALEIGSGTGYFSLNLVQLGVIERLTATDISPGMLQRLAATAADLGLEVATVQTDAEQLPFEDETFDLLFGHAVLHHIPDLDRAFAEFRRVLRPGGMIAFAGEPSRYGDRLAALPKRTGIALAPLWRRLTGSRRRLVAEAEQSQGHGLEREVDVHAFAPADLRRLLRSAGFERRRVGGEELLSNAWGWGLRTVESSAEPESVPIGWRKFAFRSYIALQKVDTGLLEPHLPAELFYNLLVSGQKPA